MKTYVPSEIDEDATVSKKSKKKRTGPKRAVTSYILFCKKQRSFVKEILLKKKRDIDGPEAKVSCPDVTRALGEAWQECKKKGGTGEYDKIAVIDKERYQKEKDNWDQDHEDDEDEKDKQNAKTKKKTTEPKKTTETKTTEKTVIRGGITAGFVYYQKLRARELFDEHKSWSGTKVNKQCLKEYKAFDTDEQVVWDERAIKPIN
jgi:septum formation inhibitor MinC